jgi:hypothetical protein
LYICKTFILNKRRFFFYLSSYQSIFWHIIKINKSSPINKKIVPFCQCVVQLCFEHHLFTHKIQLKGGWTSKTNLFIETAIFHYIFHHFEKWKIYFISFWFEQSCFWILNKRFFANFNRFAMKCSKYFWFWKKNVYEWGRFITFRCNFLPIDISPWKKRFFS